MPSIDEFRKWEFKVADILTAEPIPGTDKLLKLTIDLGEAEPRTLVAGIAKFYKPEDLVDTQIIVVANLDHAKIRGVTSQGMLLAAGNENHIAILRPDKEMPSGTRIL